jgi:hypothetical protein
MGRNGVIAIYLKKGGQPSPILNASSANTNTLVIEGFSVPNNFYSLSHENDQESLPLGADERATLYWNPYLITDSEKGSLRIEFFMNDIQSPKSIIIEGISIDGKPIKAKYSLPAGK